ncbi:MAG: T9SS type A sorting domain-containing protein [Saprospiraceae bacterium]|nr:T9SS type A sorting domain-containing protein [Saprospiraceae bacterium]
MLTITSDVTTAEAYDSKLSVKELALVVRKEGSLVETGVFELYQNSPNPFAKETNISFRLPESGAAKLTIYDVTGKVLRVYDVQGAKGLNTIKILKSELNGNGVLYYQLDSQSHTATKQMLVID